LFAQGLGLGAVRLALAGNRIDQGLGIGCRLGCPVLDGLEVDAV
jgi:hypothetical protein